MSHEKIFYFDSFKNLGNLEISTLKIIEML